MNYCCKEGCLFCEISNEIETELLEDYKNDQKIFINDYFKDSILDLEVYGIDSFYNEYLIEIKYIMDKVIERQKELKEQGIINKSKFPGCKKKISLINKLINKYEPLTGKVKSNIKNEMDKINRLFYNKS